MMKIITFFLAFTGVLLAIPVFGQCPTGNITLSTQSQINAFPVGCTTIPGNLTISESSIGNITDLSPLAELTQVNGRLLVFDNADLTTLSGLDNIATTTLSTRISKNNSLTDLIGLGGLTSVSSFLEIDNNDALTSVDGLNASLEVDGQLIINDNDELLELDGMAGITQIGDATLEISDNLKLSDISGLDGVNPASILDLVIVDNTALATCEVVVVCDYLAVAVNTATISGNAAGCTGRMEVVDACSVLPVEFRAFTATLRGKRSELLWSVTDEATNAGFYVQRSQNGASWMDLDFVPAYQGTQYIYQDESPNTGENFYRLLQEDTDGTQTFSPVRRLMITNGGASLSIYPNPASGEFFVGGLDDQLAYTIKLRDLNGRTLRTTTTNRRLALERYAPGAYMVEILQGEKTTYKRLLITK